MTAKPLVTCWTPTTPTTWDKFFSNDARGIPVSSYWQVKDDTGCCLNRVACQWLSLVGEDDLTESPYTLYRGSTTGAASSSSSDAPWLNWKKLGFRVEAVRNFCILDIRQQSQRWDFGVLPIAVLAPIQWGLSQSPSGSQRGCCWENRSFLSFIVKASDRAITYHIGSSPISQVALVPSGTKRHPVADCEPAASGMAEDVFRLQPAFTSLLSKRSTPHL